MTGLMGVRGERAAVDRRADRRVAAVSIIIAAGFLTLAVASALLPASVRVGLWLPLHLALAGAASTAVAGVMPFFSAAIATAQPVEARLRWASLALVSLGATGVTAGFASDTFAVATAGGTAFTLGMVLVAYATLMPLRRGLGPRGGVVAAGYGAALVMVVVGATLASLYLAGWVPALEAWSRLKPAHAWLNLVGFVSVVIATTLLHFFPTVIGARIQRVPVAYLTPLGLAGGAALVALGVTLDADVLARAGALSVLLGTAALVLYCGQVWRTRAHWTGDQGWHRFAMGGLTSAIAWFVLGILLASVPLLAQGARPGTAVSAPLAAPLVAGWAGLALLAAATHLLPSIGPGGPHEHARQRVILGRWASARLVAADLGVAGLTAGSMANLPVLSLGGLLLLGFAVVATGALLLAALRAGWVAPRTARP